MISLLSNIWTKKKWTIDMKYWYIENSNDGTKWTEQKSKEN